MAKCKSTSRTSDLRRVYAGSATRTDFTFADSPEALLPGVDGPQHRLLLAAESTKRLAGRALGSEPGVAREPPQGAASTEPAEWLNAPPGAPR